MAVRRYPACPSVRCAQRNKHLLCGGGGGQLPSAPNLFVGNYFRPAEPLHTTIAVKQSRWVYERGGLKAGKKKMTEV